MGGIDLQVGSLAQPWRFLGGGVDDPAYELNSWGAVSWKKVSLSLL